MSCTDVIDLIDDDDYDAHGRGPLSESPRPVPVGLVRNAYGEPPPQSWVSYSSNQCPVKIVRGPPPQEVRRLAPPPSTQYRSASHIVFRAGPPNFAVRPSPNIPPPTRILRLRAPYPSRPGAAPVLSRPGPQRRPVDEHVAPGYFRRQPVPRYATQPLEPAPQTPYQRRRFAGPASARRNSHPTAPAPSRLILHEDVVIDEDLPQPLRPEDFEGVDMQPEFSSKTIGPPSRNTYSAPSKNLSATLSHSSSSRNNKPVRRSDTASRKDVRVDIEFSDSEKSNNDDSDNDQNWKPKKGFETIKMHERDSSADHGRTRTRREAAVSASRETDKNSKKRLVEEPEFVPNPRVSRVNHGEQEYPSRLVAKRRKVGSGGSREKVDLVSLSESSDEDEVRIARSTKNTKSTAEKTVFSNDDMIKLINQFYNQQQIHTSTMNQLLMSLSKPTVPPITPIATPVTQLTFPATLPSGISTNVDSNTMQLLQTQQLLSQLSAVSKDPVPTDTQQVLLQMVQNQVQQLSESLLKPQGGGAQKPATPKAKNSNKNNGKSAVKSSVAGSDDEIEEVIPVMQKKFKGRRRISASAVIASDDDGEADVVPVEPDKVKAGSTSASPQEKTTRLEGAMLQLVLPNGRVLNVAPQGPMIASLSEIPAVEKMTKEGQRLDQPGTNPLKQTDENEFRILDSSDESGDNENEVDHSASSHFQPILKERLRVNSSPREKSLAAPPVKEAVVRLSRIDISKSFRSSVKNPTSGMEISSDENKEDLASGSYSESRGRVLSKPPPKVTSKTVIPSKKLERTRCNDADKLKREDKASGARIKQSSRPKPGPKSKTKKSEKNSDKLLKELRSLEIPQTVTHFRRELGSRRGQEDKIEEVQRQKDEEKRQEELRKKEQEQKKREAEKKRDLEEKRKLEQQRREQKEREKKKRRKELEMKKLEEAERRRKEEKKRKEEKRRKEENKKPNEEIKKRDEEKQRREEAKKIEEERLYALERRRKNENERRTMQQRKKKNQLEKLKLMREERRRKKSGVGVEISRKGIPFVSPARKEPPMTLTTPEPREAPPKRAAAKSLDKKISSDEDEIIVTEEVFVEEEQPKKNQQSQAKTLTLPINQYYYGFTKVDHSRQDDDTLLRYKCPDKRCEMNSFYDNVSTMRHLLTHFNLSNTGLDEDIWADVTRCERCFAPFTGRQAMQSHFEQTHTPLVTKCNGPHRCKICEKDLKGEIKFVQHMRSHHVANEMPFSCPVCGYRSSLFNMVVDHFVQRHNNSNWALCPFCLEGFQMSPGSEGPSWGSTVKYYCHLNIHMNRKRHKCQQCRLSFILGQQLTSHMERDHRSIKGVILRLEATSLADLITVSVSEAASATARRPSSAAEDRTKLLMASVVINLRERAGNQIRSEYAGPARVVYNLQCIECQRPLNFAGHFRSTATRCYIECDRCSYVTSCSFSFSKHQVYFHGTQNDRSKVDPVERRIKGRVLECLSCDYFSKYGRDMAIHMTEWGHEVCEVVGDEGYSCSVAKKVGPASKTIAKQDRVMEGRSRETEIKTNAVENFDELAGQVVDALLEYIDPVGTVVKELVDAIEKQIIEEEITRRFPVYVEGLSDEEEEEDEKESGIDDDGEKTGSPEMICLSSSEEEGDEDLSEDDRFYKENSNSVDFEEYDSPANETITEAIDEATEYNADKTLELEMMDEDEEDAVAVNEVMDRILNELDPVSAVLNYVVGVIEGNETVANELADVERDLKVDLVYSSDV